MRFSILTLLGLVAVAAIGTAALLNANRAWVSLTYIGVVAMLAASLVGSLILRAGKQSFAIGFAGFGISFVLAVYLLPGIKSLDFYIVEFPLWRLHSAIKTEVQEIQVHQVRFQQTISVDVPERDHFLRVGHALALAMCSFVGGLIGRYFYWLREKQEAGVAEQSR